ncbi:hypothetical protein ElyMa_003084800 [Elysia marginata]|uniref:Uncharacterized protein n=1 Tax=Elysia marginata TaxID=1093978 RepID=A0AAV4IQZ6_9GAST|nr:hypothetical protein ElyMa_003084800 [Elysia marginata]
MLVSDHTKIRCFVVLVALTSIADRPNAQKINLSGLLGSILDDSRANLMEDAQDLVKNTMNETSVKQISDIGEDVMDIAMKMFLKDALNSEMAENVVVIKDDDLVRKTFDDLVSRIVYIWAEAGRKTHEVTGGDFQNLVNDKAVMKIIGSWVEAAGKALKVSEGVFQQMMNEEIVKKVLNIWTEALGNTLEVGEGDFQQVMNEAVFKVVDSWVQAVRTAFKVSEGVFQQMMNDSEEVRKVVEIWIEAADQALEVGEGVFRQMMNDEAVMKVVDVLADVVGESLGVSTNTQDLKSDEAVKEAVHVWTGLVDEALRDVLKGVMNDDPIKKGKDTLAKDASAARKFCEDVLRIVMNPEALRKAVDLPVWPQGVGEALGVDVGFVKDIANGGATKKNVGARLAKEVDKALEISNDVFRNVMNDKTFKQVRDFFAKK